MQKTGYTIPLTELVHIHTEESLSTSIIGMKVRINPARQIVKTLIYYISRQSSMQSQHYSHSKVYDRVSNDEKADIRTVA